MGFKIQLFALKRLVPAEYLKRGGALRIKARDKPV